MKYKLILDNNNYIQCIEKSYNDNGYELNPSEMDFENLDCCILVNNEILMDDNKLKNKINRKAKEQEILRLKQELAKTDYQAIKYSEGWFTDEEYSPIKDIREALRKKIREIENS